MLHEGVRTGEGKWRIGSNGHVGVELGRRAIKILTLEEKRTGLTSSRIPSHLKLWELYYEHGAKWRRFKNGECGVVGGSRFTPIRILAMKFIKLSITWISFPGIYSWKIYIDIPGQLCKNALTRSGRENPQKVQHEQMDKFILHLCRHDKIIWTVRQSRKTTGSEWSPGWVGRVCFRKQG